MIFAKKITANNNHDYHVNRLKKKLELFGATIILILPTCHRIPFFQKRQTVIIYDAREEL